MKEITVLLPIDDSLGSKLAVEMAQKLTEMVDARFILLTSVDVGTKLTGFTEMDAALLERMESAAKALHEKVMKEFPDLNMTSEIVLGTPGVQIQTYIEKNPVDLVIMATQNNSTLRRILIGSVTNYVLHHSTVPVLAIPVKTQENK